MTKHSFLRPYCWVGVALLVLVLRTPAQALSLLSLDPAFQEVGLGSQVTVDLRMQFDEATVGGGLDLFYDPTQLDFVSFQFHPGLGDDPGLQRQPDDLLGELRGLGFGNFSGLTGALLVGTFTFNTLDLGITLLSMAVNAGGLGQPGPFVSAETFEEQEVTLQGAAISIVTPEPRTLHLMLLAGLTLCAYRWRQRRAARI